MAVKLKSPTDTDTDAEYWYRYEGYIRTYSVMADACGNCTSIKVIEPVVRRYKVLYHTPTGVRIAVGRNRVFVRNNARKRWAYPTYKLALESFIERKKMHALHLRHQLAAVMCELTLAQHDFTAEIYDGTADVGKSMTYQIACLEEDLKNVGFEPKKDRLE